MYRHLPRKALHHLHHIYTLLHRRKNSKITQKNLKTVMERPSGVDTSSGLKLSTEKKIPKNAVAKSIKNIPGIGTHDNHLAPLFEYPAGQTIDSSIRQTTGISGRADDRSIGTADHWSDRTGGSRIGRLGGHRTGWIGDHCLDFMTSGAYGTIFVRF